MEGLIRNPALVFLISIIALSCSVWLGIVVKRRRKQEVEGSDDNSVIEAATLTLLALMMGFAFSMAVNRYDQRANCESQEANTIGTEYQRAGLLPAADAAKVRALILQYVDQRISFYQRADERQLAQIAAQTTQLQDDMWSVVQTAGTAQPNPVVALAVSGMNEML